MSNGKNSYDHTLNARKELDKERAHRREKVWKIFSWAATLLVAITGGVIALKTDASRCMNVTWTLKGISSGATLVLTGFAWKWIDQNLKILRKAEKAIAKYDRKLDIQKVVPDGNPPFGYQWALILLGLAAISAIFLDIH